MPASRAVREHGGDCFSAIGAKDILVHHPYESFDVVVQFIPKPRKTRCGGDQADIISHDRRQPIVKALIEVAELGKSVTALVELKARFDEVANIRLARDMERAGGVVSGFCSENSCQSQPRSAPWSGNMKTYVHLGTGNYHPQNAKVYTDLSLFTCDREIADARKCSITSPDMPSRI